MHSDDVHESLFSRFNDVRPGAIVKLIKDSDKQDSKLIAALKILKPLSSKTLNEIDGEFYKRLVLKSEFKYAETWKGAVIVLEFILRKRGLMAGGRIIRRRTRRNRLQNQ
jgi:hypothetical protein